MENSREVPEKTKNRAIIWACSPFPGHISREKHGLKRNIHLSVHCSTAYSSQDMEATHCPSTEEWIKKRWYMYTMEYYSAVKKNGVMPFAATKVDLESGECHTEWSESERKYHISSVQFSCSVVSDSLRPHELQHTRPSCLSPAPRVHPNPCPSSQWCHPATSSSVVNFSCRQSLPASGSFPMSQLFAWGGQSIGVSALASFIPMNTQDWSSLGWTGWISLQSKGLSRVFSDTTVQKHLFFKTQLTS